MSNGSFSSCFAVVSKVVHDQNMEQNNRFWLLSGRKGNYEIIAEKDGEYKRVKLQSFL